MASDFKVIERIWAENGVVLAVDKEGQQTSMTVSEAARKAIALNQMDVPDWHKKARNDLVTEIIEVCRKAKSQQETPSSTKEKAVTNVLQGKTAEGKIPVYSKQQQIEHYLFKYYTLKEHEAEAVVASSLPPHRKEEVLKEIHRQNMMQMEDIDRSAAEVKKIVQKAQEA